MSFNDDRESCKIDTRLQMLALQTRCFDSVEKSVNKIRFGVRLDTGAGLSRQLRSPTARRFFAHHISSGNERTLCQFDRGKQGNKKSDKHFGMFHGQEGMRVGFLLSSRHLLDSTPFQNPVLLPLLRLSTGSSQITLPHHPFSQLKPPFDVGLVTQHSPSSTIESGSDVVLPLKSATCRKEMYHIVATDL